jgi:AAA domain
LNTKKRTVLVYARSRGGKTTLLGEFAEWQYALTGKPLLVYSIDKGGVGPILPHIDLGVIKLIQQEKTDPWVFMRQAVLGNKRDEKGKWASQDLSQFSGVAFESMTAFSDAFMEALAEMSAKGVNIGGAANVSISVASDGVDLKIGGNNMGHYNVVQTRILSEVWRSQNLNLPYIIWTASASREDDTNASGKVIGPEIAGKKMTSEMLRQFDLTFRLDCSPAQGTVSEKHTLYLGNSVDTLAGGAVALGNTRVPLGAKLKDGKELPSKIEPATLVGALKMIEEAEEVAREAIKSRIRKG